MDVLSLNQRFIRELLALYRELPAVWKVKCADYKNKELKRSAYNILVSKCREFVPDADREFVKNKINSLRTSFRKEYKKYIKSRDTPGSMEVYTPKLWYYNLLLFTVDDDPNQTHEESLSLVEDTGFFDLKSEPGSPELTVIEHDPLSVPVNSSTPIKQQVTSSRNSVLQTEDVYDAIGKNVAHKLRSMCQQQQIIAEKIISDVMYHGQMETLTPESHLAFKKNVT